MATYSGVLNRIDTKQGRNGNFLRIECKGMDGNGMWFSCFDKVAMAIIQQTNTGTEVEIEYSSTPWIQDGVQRGMNHKVDAITTAGVQVQVGEPVASASPSGMYDWASKLDVVGRSIIRQSALKNVEDKDSKSPEELWRLANIYEDIILGRFKPESDGDLLETWDE